MVFLKTAYMIGLSAQMGGIISNLSEKEILELKEFGDCIGMAYQVQDDLLELFSDSKSMKKSLESDFRLNKKTFLWVSTPETLRSELDSILSNYNDDKDGTINKLRNFMEVNRIKQKAEFFIGQNIENSKRLLDRMSGNTQFLGYFSDLIFNREY